MKKTIRLTAILMAAVLMMGICAIPAAADVDDDDLAEVFGYVEENIYVNDFFDFAYMLPDDTFSFATDEELQLQGRLAKSIIKSDDFDVNDLPETWMEMMATSAETGENVNAAITIIPDEALAAYEMFSMRDVVEMSLETLKSTLETSGMSVEYLDIDDEFEYSFDNYACIRGKLSYMGATMYEEMLYLYEDGFQIVLTATGLTEEKPNELLEYLFILEDDDTADFADTDLDDLTDDADDDGDSDSSGTLNDLLDQLNGILGGLNGGN